MLTTRGSPGQSPGMATRALHVQMDDIVEAMDAPEGAPESVLDLQTGEVDWCPDEDAEDAEGLDGARHVRVPRFGSREAYDLMRGFAERVEEDDVRAQLDVALGSRGAFGRFRAVVSQFPDLAASWHAMRRDALVEEAKRWLAGLDVEPVYELRPIPGLGRPAQENKRAYRIDLLDMLLLGAPEGKTELIGGRVFRLIDARTPSNARRIFTDLARDACGYFGVAWSKRLVEGRDACSIERAHFRIVGTRVELDLEVEGDAWRAFAEG